jgi:hypothetical protein
MNNPKTNQTARVGYSTTLPRASTASQAAQPTGVPALATVATGRFAPRQMAPIQHPRDGHWGFYACIAVFCLAATFVILSFASKGYWD